MEHQNQPQQPFAPVTMMPFWPPHQVEHRVLDSHSIPNTTPVRVGAALEFVAYMGHRIEPMVAVDNMGVIHKEHKQPLSNAERGAFDAACELLTDYFNGSMELNQLELQRHASCEFELARRYPGMPMPCPVCGGGAVPDCRTCRGSGKVLMMPLPPEEQRENQQPKKPRTRKERKPT